MRFRFSTLTGRAVVAATLILFSGMFSCREARQQSDGGFGGYRDVPFIEEWHKPFIISSNRKENEVRRIAIDTKSDVWIATASGVFVKRYNNSEWEPVIIGEERGPAYSVFSNPGGDVLLGTWNGLYRYRNDSLFLEGEVKAPVSQICSDGEGGNFAAGPFGIWQYKSGKWEFQGSVARSVRDSETDKNGNLWLATDAGLYKFKNGNSVLFQDTTELLSCNANAISFSPNGDLWAGVLGGISIRREDKLFKNLLTGKEVPSARVNCITASGDGTMWVGTDAGIVRYSKDLSRSYRFTRRWLTSNRVNDIAFDREGNGWVATDNGVSAIMKEEMTLSQKEAYFYKRMMNRHIRPPWICCNLRLEVPGDTATWSYADDDNDGEYTGGYLAMESFRYAATGDIDAREKAHKAFAFLRFLREVTGTEGFFARTVIPSDWIRMNDTNRLYSKQEIADQMVRDPRFKPLEKRWHLSKDKKWLWKGDTSSDEMDGHMMGYFFYYEYAADENEKRAIIDHVKKIMNNLISAGYNLVDVDGTHTRWGVWSPDLLNRDPDWASERSLNSFELLAYLKFAAHITGDVKYEKEYHRLIDQEGYLKNASGLNSKNPAWQIYFDRTMEGYLFPILLKYETDPVLNTFYRNLIDEWIKGQPEGENLINNLTYALSTGKIVNLKQTIDFLKDAPLDLVDWKTDLTLREDVRVVRKPVPEELQVAVLPPASERSTVRWDKNPWAAVSGDPSMEREPNFWLWPYWMARYLGAIKP